MSFITIQFFQVMFVGVLLHSKCIHKMIRVKCKDSFNSSQSSLFWRKTFRIRFIYFFLFFFLHLFSPLWTLAWRRWSHVTSMEAREEKVASRRRRRQQQHPLMFSFKVTSPWCCQKRKKRGLLGLDKALAATHLHLLAFS